MWVLCVYVSFVFALTCIGLENAPVRSCVEHQAVSEIGSEHQRQAAHPQDPEIKSKLFKTEIHDLKNLLF